MFIFNAGKEAMKLSLIMSWQSIFWQHFQKKNLAIDFQNTKQSLWIEFRDNSGNVLKVKFLSIE